MPNRLLPHARTLRREATSAERRLWSGLRRQKMSGYKFRRQVVLGSFIADFACYEARLILEVDGATHSTHAELLRDAARGRILRGFGYAILRFTNDEVFHNLDGVLETIRVKLTELRPRIEGQSVESGATTRFIAIGFLRIGHLAMAIDALLADMTPEQVLALQLRAIFLPKAHSYILDHFKDVPPGSEPRFVHYTSAEAGLKIIKSKRVWMRNTLCMTDNREVHHGFDMFSNFFRVPQNKSDFISALDVCAPGAAEEAINLFDGWLNDLRLNTYVASLSEHRDEEDLHGRLSMWRAFGGNGAGRIAFVLKIPRLSHGAEALNMMFSPIAYWEEKEVHQELRSVIDNVNENISWRLCRS